MLFRSIADVAAGRARSLPVVARAADFRAGSARDAFRHVSRSGVMRLIVARSAHHRFVLFVRLAGVVAFVRKSGRRFWSDVAEDSASNLILVLCHGHASSTKSLQVECHE